VRQVQRAARRGDRHVRHQVQGGGVGGDQQREEHVVLALEGEQAVGAGLGDLGGAGPRLGR
jgi:hypothetical protein